MSTNMKELFKTDLDPNSSNWWSIDKIDKINWNFKQFADGGQIGPRGSQGAYGGTGYAGNQGPQGPQGIRGFQGTQGDSGERIWKYLEDTLHGELYVFPKTISTTHAVSMRIGEKNGAPGSTYNTLIDESVKGPTITIENRDSENSQLVISHKHDGVKKRGDFKFTRNLIDNVDLIRIGNLVNSEPFSLDLVSNSTVSVLNSIQYSSDKISFDKDAVFNFNFLSTSITKYSLDSGINKVLVSTNSNGDVSWVSKSSVFGNFPIGSIISIQYGEFFNDANFYLDESILNGGEVLSCRYGKGKPGTPYEGWYLCNGETWDYSSIISHTVPNLNSFNYSIDSNNASQNLANGGDNSIIIVGGWNSRSTSTMNVSDYTTVLSEDDTSDVPVVFDNNGSTSEIKRNVHIIYLEDSRLLWENNNSIIIPPTLYSIALTPVNSTSTGSCGATVTDLFNITISNQTWSSFSITGSGYELYNNLGTSSAAAGWYQRDGISRYWNGSAFTQKVTCNVQRSFAFGSNVLLFNGSAIPFEDYNPLTTTYDTFYINSISFSDATIMKKSTGENCVAGWYREIDGFGFVNGDLGGTRRYWDGNSFIGISIDQDYVRTANNPSYGLYYGTSTTGVCENGVLQKTYYSSDLSTFAPVGVTVNSTPLVHVGYTQGVTGSFPLSRVNTQNGFGVYSPYNRLKSVSAPINYGIIDVSSGVVSSGNYSCPIVVPPNNCQGYTLRNHLQQDDGVVRYVKCGETSFTFITVGIETFEYICTDGTVPVALGPGNVTITQNTTSCIAP